MRLVRDGYAIEFDASSFVRFAITSVASIICGRPGAGKQGRCGVEGAR